MMNTKRLKSESLLNSTWNSHACCRVWLKLSLEACSHSSARGWLLFGIHKGLESFWLVCQLSNLKEQSWLQIRQLIFTKLGRIRTEFAILSISCRMREDPLFGDTTVNSENTECFVRCRIDSVVSFHIQFFMYSFFEYCCISNFCNRRQQGAKLVRANN